MMFPEIARTMNGVAMMKPLATIITAQLPVSGWHDMIGEPTIADAILDRIVHNAHRIDLKGDSMRRKDQNKNLTHLKNPETIPSET